MTDAEREMVRKLIVGCDALMNAFARLLPAPEDIRDEAAKRAAQDAMRALLLVVNEAKALWHPRPSEPS